MKSDAYSFSKQVDQEIENLSSHDYLRRIGRSKKLQEELFPISRLGLFAKKPGLEVFVEAFEDSGPIDACITISGFYKEQFNVEVTCIYSQEESLRDELLATTGSAPGAGPIWRERKTKAINAKQACVDADSHFALIADLVIERFNKKAQKTYPPNTHLLIAFSEPKIYAIPAWHRISIELHARGLNRPQPFNSVFLFNSATNDIVPFA